MIDTEALRKKVIDLAIQGKLTEQLPSDGDAETLYTQIQENKAKLIKEGKIKKQQTKPMTDTVPFDIPNNWKWVRVGDIEEINLGFTYRPEYVDEGVYFLSAKDISGGKVNFEEAKKVSVDTYENAAYGSKPRKGDVLFCRVGTIGKPQVIYDDVEFCIFVSLGFFRDHFKIIVPEYIALWMNSKLFDKQVDFEVKGALQRNLNTGWLKDFLVPLPPCSEQKRIVERVDIINEQINIIDDLQAKYSNDLAVLKSKIIDAGIQGKLTEQLPEDGDAEDLYAQILNQKSQLIKEGKIKKEKSLPDITEDEIPFEIPKNWKWVRFGNLMWNRDSERIPVSVADRKKLAKTYDYYGASGVIDKVEEYLFDEKLLLIGEDGANLLSRSTPIAFLAEGKYWVNNHAHVLGYYKYDYLDFVMYYINSISLVPYVTGAAQPKLNQENMNKIPVPLPPYSEQKRIVEKIEAIMEQLN